MSETRFRLVNEATGDSSELNVRQGTEGPSVIDVGTFSGTCVPPGPSK